MITFQFPIENCLTKFPPLHLFLSHPDVYELLRVTVVERSRRRHETSPVFLIDEERIVIIVAHSQPD